MPKLNINNIDNYSKEEYIINKTKRAKTSNRKSVKSDYNERQYKNRKSDYNKS